MRPRRPTGYSSSIWTARHSSTDYDKQSFKQREMESELGHETRGSKQYTCTNSLEFRLGLVDSRGRTL